MITELLPSSYLDVVYGKGVHVVLLHIGDDLYRLAHEEFEDVDARLSDSQWIRLWECRITNPEECAEVQVCIFPQYRFFFNGQERGSNTGVMRTEDVLQKIYGLEDAT